MKTLKKVLQYIGTYRFWMLASIVLAAVTVALTLYIPILVGRAIDFIVDWKNVDFENILKLLIEIGILAAVTAVLQWLMNTINNKVTYQVVRDVRNQAFTRIQKLPLKYLDAHSYGEIVSRVIGCRSVCRWTSDGIYPVVYRCCYDYRNIDLYADDPSGNYTGGCRTDTDFPVCGKIYCKTDV